MTMSGRAEDTETVHKINFDELTITNCCQLSVSVYFLLTFSLELFSYLCNNYFSIVIMQYARDQSHKF